MRKALIWIIILIIVGFGVYRIISSSQEKEVHESVREIKTPVIVQTVKKMNIKQILRFTGDIKGQEEIEAYPKVPGKLINNRVKEGDFVKKGTVLALVDRDITGLQYEPFEVLSPISGVIGKVYWDKGDTLNPPTMGRATGTPVARVINMDNVRVVINIPEKDLFKAKKGQTAEVNVDGYPGKIFNGILKVLSPIVDNFTRTAKAEVEIPNTKHSLRPGMFAKVGLIVNEKKDVVVIPDEVVIGLDEKYIYVIKNNVAEKRIVKTGIMESGYVEVLEGIKEGESLVIVGQEMLQDGSNVTIVSEST